MAVIITGTSITTPDGLLGGGGVDTGTTLPASGSNGDLFLNTDGDGKIYFWNDGTWNSMDYFQGYKPNTVSGEAVFTSVGNSTWTVPAGVKNVCVVAVGGGGGAGAYSTGGGGGGLVWLNSWPVTSGSTYEIYVGDGGTKGASGSFGTNGEDSTFGIAGGETYVRAYGGKGAGVWNQVKEGALGGGNLVSARVPAGNFGGGQGGQGGSNYDPAYISGGGGGAGGYSGNGGRGAGRSSVNSSGTNGTDGSGGGGGGGGGFHSTNGYSAGAGGGGVGLYGEGSNGAGGNFTNNVTDQQFVAVGGGGGSGGQDGVSHRYSAATTSVRGLYGGGAAGNGSGDALIAWKGGNGAVRIVWKTGDLGSYGFPSTNVS